MVQPDVAAGGRPETVDEPRWCRFKQRQVVFTCAPGASPTARTRPRRCLERTPECVTTHRCVFAGQDQDPFHGSI